MKRLTVFIFIAVLGCSVPDLYSQRVVKIVGDYILIDRIIEGSKAGDDLYVYRKVDGGYLRIGRIGIVTFREGKTAAKIRSLSAGSEVRIGDLVSRVDIADVNRQQKNDEPNVGGWLDQTFSAEGARGDGYDSAVLPFLAFCSVMPGPDIDRHLSFGWGASAGAALFPHRRISACADITASFHETGTGVQPKELCTLISFNACLSIRMNRLTGYQFGAGYLTVHAPAEYEHLEELSGLQLFAGISLDLMHYNDFIITPRIRAGSIRHAGNWNAFAAFLLNVAYCGL